jgi:hypothetical protein
MIRSLTSLIIIASFLSACARGVEEHSPTGELSGRGNVSLTGAKQGDWEMYFIPTGEVLSRGRYDNDRQVGVWTYYRVDGSVESTEEFDYTDVHLVSGRRWVTTYLVDGKTIDGFIDASYGLTIARSTKESWVVTDNDDFSQEHPPKVGAISFDGKVSTFIPNDGSSVALPIDMKQWCKIIRQVVTPPVRSK